MSKRALKSGFSLIELLMATLLMGITLLSFFWMNSFSNRSAMDAHHELIAMQLAREPIERLRGLGYQWLKKNESSALAELKSRFNEKLAGSGLYPIEASYFSRVTTIEHNQTADPDYFLVKVEIHRGSSSWLSRPLVSLGGIIWNCPP